MQENFPASSPLKIPVPLQWKVVMKNCSEEQQVDPENKIKSGPHFFK